MTKNPFALRSRLGFFLGPAVFLLCLIVPTPEGLTPEAQRVGAIALLMAIWWIAEALPMAAIALLPIALFPLFGIMPTGTVTAQYGSHIIFLFMGGFFIAVTMERWNLHKRLALTIISWVGVGPSRIILGFMIASAFLSMWVSNTATAMMMVPIGIAVIRQAAELLNKQTLESGVPACAHYNFSTALMLGIAYACSIGGVGTIIGTPPNTVLVGVIETMFDYQVSFLMWMAFGVPLAIVMLITCWFYLVRFAFPLGLKELPGGLEFIQSEKKSIGKISYEERAVLIVFGLVAFAWIGRGFVDWPALQYVNDSSIAILGALILFAVPSDFKKGEFLLDWPTAVKIPWGIIILFGGGLALAHGFSSTGLAAWLASFLGGLGGMHILVLLLAVVGLTLMLTEVTSNTATSTMLMPIMASMAIAIHIHPFGLMVAAAVASSYAFMLPVATPPNAVVFGSGYISIPQMARAGVWLNLIAVVVITLFVAYLMPVVWGIDIGSLPEWLMEP
jgi:sodium-dependent dicarboxylate transporter 2/3/5